MADDDIEQPPAENDASDARAVREKRRKERDQARIDDGCLMAVLATPEGRHTIWRLLGWTHLLETSFTGDSRTFFREGERNIGLKLHDEIVRVDLPAYLTMQSEHLKEKTK